MQQLPIIGSYDLAQYCLNGHLINSRYHWNPMVSRDYCQKCGEKTITNCLHCNAEFIGDYMVNDDGDRTFIDTDLSQIHFCHGCGKPYPWTIIAMEAANELADMAEGLSVADKELLKKSLDDIIKDTPKTVVASNRFKQLMAKGGSELATGLRSIMINIASESAKQLLWPK